ncbi:iron ABC transporter permease [Oligoflexaceae bacterium]|nr:iron ABC transporter permease [Oligoflexaceae bacterium]
MGLVVVSALYLWAGDIFSFDADTTHVLLYEIRGPRWIKCLITGSAMSVAGVLTQSLFRNSLAAPSVLGVSSGASLAACLAFLVAGGSVSYWLLPMSSFAGAILVLFLVTLLAKVFKLMRTDNLLLLGFSFNIFFGAVISLVIAVSLERPGQMPSIMHWLMGDFSYPTRKWLPAAGVTTLLSILLATKLSRRLETLTVGEEVAETLGVNPEKLKFQILMLVALLVGLSVSLVGAIPFVGLIVPHIAKRLFGSRLRALIPTAAVTGMIFVTFADLLAKSLRNPVEIPTGILLALCGAPFFIAILVRGAREQ